MQINKLDEFLRRNKGSGIKGAQASAFRVSHQTGPGLRRAIVWKGENEREAVNVREIVGLVQRAGEMEDITNVLGDTLRQDGAGR